MLMKDLLSFNQSTNFILVFPKSPTAKLLKTIVILYSYTFVVKFRFSTAVILCYGTT